MSPKVIYHATFSFRYTYQYYTKTKNVLLKSGKPHGPYSGVRQRIYLEGDEEKIWESIKKELGDCVKKRYTLVSKEIIDVHNTGKQNKR